MGIFSYNLRSILEVKRKVNGQEEDLDNEEQEDDNEEPEQEDTNNESEENNENDEANNYTMGDVEDDSNDNSENTDQESENDDESNDTESNTGSEDDNSEANNYNMGDVDGESDDMGDDSQPDNSSSDEDESTTDETEGSENELKSLEDDIFKDIPPEQMNIKIMELKKQYLEVYATITDVLSRTNKIPKTSQNMSVLEFIINKLMELKDIVQFYLSNTFDTKTYVENMVNYQQYLATLNTINRLLKEISRKKENNT